MPNRDGPSLAYHRGTDSFNLYGPHGEEVMTFSADELREFVVEGARLLHDRSLLYRGKDGPPLNDSAEVSYREV